MTDYRCRGIRGATCVSANDEATILEATRDLLKRIVAANGVQPEDVASVFFTATSDLNATFPALAARELGWVKTALLCAQEIEVPGSMPHVIRVLVHWNTTKPLEAIQHVYINGAEALRPDFAEGVTES